MEYNLSQKMLSTAHPLLDTVSEQPVDLELTLPDYCPDIERILRCMLIPKVYLSNLSGDRLAVDGGACVRIVYLDAEKGCPRSFEYTAPFSESFALKDSPEDCTVSVDTKAEYLNCRALSPRKLSLHGAFSLYARVTVKRPVPYRGYEEDDDLQVRCDTLAASELTGLCCDMFGVGEDIPMSGRPNVAAFITHQAAVRITELKAIHGKIMLTAEGRLELMYLTDPVNGGIECMTHAFTLSRVVDCVGADDDSVIDASLSIMSYDLTLNDDALDGSGVIALDMKLCFNALCWSEKEISVMEDAFSTEREIELRREPLSCRCGVRCLSFTDAAKATVSLEGESISRVLSVRAEHIAVSAAVSGGAPLLSSKLTVSMVFVNTEGDTRWIDRDIEFNYNPSTEDFDSVDSVSAAVDSLSYRMVNENTVEIRAGIIYHMTVSRRVSRPAVTAVTAPDEAEPYAESDALILCFADKGEQIWDIAKRYHTRPADILEENELEDEPLDDDTMLMIVTKGSGR